MSDDAQRESEAERQRSLEAEKQHELHESENQKKEGESENPKKEGESENPKKEGESENQKKEGESDNQKKEGESENQKKEGESENQKKQGEKYQQPETVGAQADSYKEQVDRMALVTGSKCLDLVISATQCIKSNPKAAQRHLAVIKQTVPPLLDQLRKREGELETKRDEHQREESMLEREIDAKQDLKEQHRRRVNELEAQKARNDSLLNDAQNDLRRAERDKEEAERKKKDAIGGTVGGGVGAVVLGILFPPSLAVTVPVVATAGTISITEAGEKIDRCTRKISTIKSDIEDQRSQISAANDVINGIQREISELTSKQQSLYAQRGQVRNEIVFLQKAVTYFAELHVAVKGGHEKTDLLHRIVAKVNERQQYQVMDSKGGTIVLGSFKEAWARVEDKIISGDEDGYTRIEFVQHPKLQY